MKNIFHLLVAVLVSFQVFAQSDNCSTATMVSLTNGTACVNGTTVGATSNNILYGACNTASVNEVWFTYVATGSQNDFTITSLGLTNAEIVIDVDGCANTTFEICNTVAGAATLNQSWGIAPGAQVWVGIASNGGVQGNFQLCINSSNPSPGGGNTCAGAIPICNNTYSVPSMAPFTASGQYPSCFLSAPQQDIWLEFTILSSGTFSWQATTLCNAEFDWALWNVTGGCPGAEVRCNYNYAFDNSGTFGMVAGPGACSGESCDPVNVVAGQVYALQIDNYTTANNCGFNFTWLGTAQIAPTASFTINPNTVTCGASVNVTINNTSVGTPDWDFGNGNTYTGTTPPSQTYSTPGTYAITATIPGACPATASQFVQLYGPLAGTIASTNAACPSATNGTASVTSVTGGNGVYTYLWNTGATTPSISGLAPGNYSVTISNAVCGSSIVLNTTVGAGPVPTFTAAGTNPTACGGTNGSILLSGLLNNTSYSVTYVDGATTVGPTNYTSSGSGTINLTGLNAGSYSGFSVTLNSSGCTGTIPTVISLVDPGAPVLVVTPPAAVCSPATVNLTAPAVTAGSSAGTLSYWTNAACTIALSSPSAVSTSNTYYIQLTNAGCSDIEPVVVTVNQTPNLTINNPAAACSPNTVDITTAAVTAGSTNVGSLSYWNDAGATSSLSTPSAVTTSNTYYIQATNAGCTDIASVTVTINPTPNLTITDPTAVCSPNTVDITAAAVTAGSTNVGTLTYWNDAAATSSLSTPGAITTSNTYYIQATNAGCTDIAPVLVTVNATPVLSITDPGAVCSPNTVDLTAAAVTAGSTNVGSLTYWNDAGATSSLTAPGAVAISNTYYIQASNAGCTDIAPVIVTITPSPNLIITNPAAVCSPATVDITAVAVTAGSTNATTLTYWNDAAATSTLSTPSAIATSNTYYIQATNAGCTDIAAVTVVVNAVPLAPTAGSDSTYCASWTLENMTAVGGSGTFTWYTDATLLSVFGTGSSIAPAGNNGTVIYYVTETLNGCEGPASTVTITIQDCEIIVPTAITPNGDGVHDTWEIVDLDDVYPNNVVTVFNRWGNIIYQSTKGNYAGKPWDGTYEGNALPVASYYFVIDFNDEDKGTQTGIVSIVLDK
jgi:gliding motility-associated-like protein